MTRWVLLPAFRPGVVEADVDGWLRAARAVEQDHPEVTFSDAELDLPLSFGGGDATWDLTSAAPPEQLAGVAVLTTPGAGPLLRCSRVALEPIATGSDPFDGPRVKRTLLLTVRPGTPPPVVNQFEASLAAMGERVAGIRGWSLNRVDPERSDAPWTHAWEQEFVDAADFRRGYLRSDYHLTAVDRWFDSEVPGAIVVEATVANTLRPAQRPILA